MFISAIIPTQGAEIYEGVRTTISLTEEEAYEDLADWLDGTFTTVIDTIDRLNQAVTDNEIKLWKVEEQKISL